MDVFYDLKPRVQGNRQVIRRKSCGSGVPSLNSGGGGGGCETQSLKLKTSILKIWGQTTRCNNFQ